MINITSACKKFNSGNRRKLPGHFMLLREMQECRQLCKITTGLGGATFIPDTKLALFMCWLSPEFKFRIMDKGESALAIYNEL